MLQKFGDFWGQAATLRSPQMSILTSPNGPITIRSLATELTSPASCEALPPAIGRRHDSNGHG